MGHQNHQLCESVYLLYRNVINEHYRNVCVFRLTKEVYDSLKCLSSDQLHAVNTCKDEVGQFDRIMPLSALIYSGMKDLRVFADFSDLLQW